ncbi:MAG: 2-succinyl-5-enolpyruvyl-6-hydroxy-3-cyclohexene-1-carboxylic-acid synthase, partial [Hymenobacteraceae bacterium]|nr:2-succinyl-5-enolpyruvyl-6-hydroxy-3-cyclohexene-1-carboxylic-acid synthase [Hymenobacteraceae bacterium]MDX5396320.1 2-succinyl-5-enolpyruvyl-6-hydroxy-3-cyclohexene-1-carboxylic-acid synthase [Hymenobacteraceae bacterium]MDX5512380.1 2-succinyl-5-enolpyruvyl-6-hydroxy-3-cyclohexene-1-carboxylic-acid synthase [Hymenobacteraceae bacterium]
HSLSRTIRHHDTFLSAKGQPIFQKLKPQLLITFGKSIISKNLKLFIRAHQPQQHWHLQPAGQVADTFQALTHVLRTQSKHFFNDFTKNASKTDARQAYELAWQQQEAAAKNYLKHFFSAPSFNEFSALEQVWKQLPGNSKLHLANSMSVRYANLLALASDKNIEVYANRGTSGIDGSSSTAVGSALADSRITTLITGDLAFFYDRNALWHNYLPQNLRIVLLNNHGGGIFRMIDGPKQQPELKEFFETHQQLSAENTARDFNLQYYSCNTIAEIAAALPAFFDINSKAAVLEVFTSTEINTNFFMHFKKSSPFNC